MKKLPRELVGIFWNNLSVAWKNTLKKSFDLGEKVNLNELCQILSAKSLSINVNEDPDDDDIDVKTLSPLKYFIELKELRIQNTSIDSLSYLHHLPNLKSLYIHSCNLEEEYSSIGYLEKLETLEIWNSDLDDIHWIQGLLHLKDLKLINTKILDISSIYRLVNLEKLEFWGDHAFDEQLAIYHRLNPQCEINVLKKAFDITSYLNSNPDADPSDFGYETITFGEEIHKWDYESAPDDIKEHMYEVYERIRLILENEYFPNEYDDEDVDNDRLKIEIDDIMFFVICSNEDRKAKIHYLGCDFWELSFNNE